MCSASMDYEPAARERARPLAVPPVGRRSHYATMQLCKMDTHSRDLHARIHLAIMQDKVQARRWCTHAKRLAWQHTGQVAMAIMPIMQAQHELLAPGKCTVQPRQCTPCRHALRAGKTHTWHGIQLCRMDTHCTNFHARMHLARMPNKAVIRRYHRHATWQARQDKGCRACRPRKQAQSTKHSMQASSDGRLNSHMTGRACRHKAWHMRHTHAVRMERAKYVSRETHLRYQQQDGTQA